MGWHCQVWQVCSQKYFGDAHHFFELVALLSLCVVHIIWSIVNFLPPIVFRIGLSVLVASEKAVQSSTKGATEKIVGIIYW